MMRDLRFVGGLSSWTVELPTESRHDAMSQGLQATVRLHRPARQAAGDEGGTAVLPHASGLAMNLTAKRLEVDTTGVQDWFEHLTETCAQEPAPKSRALVTDLDKIEDYLKRSRISFT
jgi:hypothetical protein